jgi:NAD(P)-dependent dehydrogenase (short-subunit alcohol dehydrogenase family)
MLQGKKILVAGAGGLLGCRLLVALVEYGATVIAADINKTFMEQRLNKIGFKETSKVSFIELDLNSEKDVDDFFSRFENLDGAVNCTYPRNSRYGAKLFDVKLNDFNENVSLHLGSSFLFMQQCASYFRREKRAFSLVNISSIYGVVAPKFEVYDNAPMTMPVEYAAIKSAIIHLSKYLTAYVSDSLFRSNCVSPGGILDGQSEVFLKQYKKQCLGKGMLDIDDVLGSIVFLLSDHSRYMNGQNLIVDDGFSL